MKKILIIVLILSACSKKKQVDPALVTVTYEIQTTVAGFSQVKYMEYQSSSTGSALVDWNIAAAGTFTKTAKVPKGSLAELSAIHPSSNSWKLVIKSSTGQILNESTSISYYAGPPSYYFKTLDVAAQ